MSSPPLSSLATHSKRGKRGNSDKRAAPFKICPEQTKLQSWIQMLSVEADWNVKRSSDIKLKVHEG